MKLLNLFPYSHKSRAYFTRTIVVELTAVTSFESEVGRPTMSNVNIPSKHLAATGQALPYSPVVTSGKCNNNIPHRILHLNNIDCILTSLSNFVDDVLVVL